MTGVLEGFILEDMEVSLTADQEMLVRHAVAVGRFRDAGDAVQEAFPLGGAARLGKVGFEQLTPH